ncbi:hypothetical protein E8L90_21210 [Brevibacillus antibioticus]|uniref:Uncharacterized protein n=1 Tax=Brevibacillus antibioticus TaxID=2570228 RepID=A0A4U2YAI8_9BACL|nr:hypothetical protein [Brevibacillus antibioticus]TKI57748.1 hypothetical protein E8L90_21210 [Brevibacillus antibioticus]
MKKMFAALFFTLVMLVTMIPQTHASILPIILAYEKAKDEGTPAPVHEVVEDAPLPVKDAPPWSSKDRVDDGELVQRRYYDQNGKVELDIDYNDHGNPKQHPKVPHRHDWYWPPVGPPSRGKWY